jgi:hypothetical protein
MSRCLFSLKTNKDQYGTASPMVRYRGMETNLLATMQSYWVTQRHVAQMRKQLESDRDLRSRGLLEALLRTEERKLTDMSGLSDISG